MDEGERVLIERVRLGDIDPLHDRLLSYDEELVIPAPATVPPDDNTLVYRVGSWMPSCPPHVNATKWRAIEQQLEAVHSLMEEAHQDHLRPQSVANLMDEAAVATRKLGVELEAAGAVARKSASKETTS